MELKAGSEGGVSPAQVLGQLQAEIGPVWPDDAYWKLTREKLKFKDEMDYCGI